MNYLHSCIMLNKILSSKILSSSNWYVIQIRAYSYFTLDVPSKQISGS